MKKIIVLFLIVFLVGGCGSNEVTYDQPTGTISDMSDYGIESENFYDITYSELFDLLDEGKTTIVYLGHAGCAWCEDLVPVLDEVCSELEMKVYYLNTLSDENFNDDEGLAKLIELCAEFTTESDDGEAVIWAPSVIYIQKGEIIGLKEGTVNTYDAYQRDMTEKETARLKYNLNKGFESVLVIEE